MENDDHGDPLISQIAATCARGILTIRILNVLRSREGAMPLTARQLELLHVSSVSFFLLFFLGIDVEIVFIMSEIRFCL